MVAGLRPLVSTLAPIRGASLSRLRSLGRGPIRRSVSGARGSVVVVDRDAGEPSLKSPPAALSQISTEIVSPSAILKSAGSVFFLKRARKLSFGWASQGETTRRSTPAA